MYGIDYEPLLDITRSLLEHNKSSRVSEDPHTRQSSHHDNQCVDNVGSYLHTTASWMESEAEKRREIRSVCGKFVYDILVNITYTYFFF